MHVDFLPIDITMVPPEKSSVFCHDASEYIKGFMAIIILFRIDRLEKLMETVTVSSKYQIVLPKEARQVLGIRSGQKMVVIAYDNRIVLVAERPIHEARGSLKGIDTSIERDGP